jgi:protein-L-isoaspartate(D-aspartate) O-methyltransferase
VIPVGATQQAQELVRVRRIGEHEYQEEKLGAVRFVPLIGAQGWVGRRFGG